MAEIARQRWSAARYAETAHFVPALGAPVLGMLEPSPGEHILDLGCGDGVLTENIVAAGATVIAVDAAPEMVAAARARGIDAAAAGPSTSARRSRRSFAPRPDGRDRNVDRRLRAASLSRDPRRITPRALIPPGFHWQCEVGHTA